MADNRQVTVLDEFIIEREKDFPYATGELSSLLRHIALAGKFVNRAVNEAGLMDVLGKTGGSNVHGEEVQKLDDYANNKFIESLRMSGLCCGITTEENKEPITPDDHEQTSKYIVAVDPLDGSSNIDVNVSIGSIFSIYRSISPDGQCFN
ncbi:MAG: fructose-bisphosphatase class I, partial [Bacteroidetes bacterium SW_11_45_7]